MQYSALVRICRAFLVVSAVFSASVFANVRSQLPDPYAEPGLNPFRNQISANADERIDPFSGALHLSHVDLVIPGNGGFDINIRRTYNSNNVYLSRKTDTNLAPNLTTLLPRTPTGLGWTLHFGRVLKSSPVGTPNICDTNSLVPNDDVLDNAILELPDGSQQILYVSANSTWGTFVTRDQWVASCMTGGLRVISPEGTVYEMTHLRAGGLTYTNETDYAWYPTRITDRNGNWMQIAYDTGAASTGKEAVFQQITTRDGRTVTFTYADRTSSTQIRLTRISANGQNWDYVYTAVSGVSGGYYQLTRVEGPSGFTWQYAYHALSSGAAGNRILQRVTYPYGGTTTYSYGYVCFNAPPNTTCSSAYNNFFSLVVTQKTNGGTDVTAGTWSYTYTPGRAGSLEDQTQVTLPGSGNRIVYKHFGSQYMFGADTVSNKNIWRIGLLKEKEVFNSNSSIHKEIYTWDKLFRISWERNVRPPYDPDVYFDEDVYIPVLTQRQIVRDGTTYSTVYSNFDASFNPRRIAETGQANRTTNLTYFPRTAGQNIVRLVKDEELEGESAGKNIYRTFSSAGNLQRLTRHGVTEDYTYDSDGNLRTRTNARGQVWTYTNYRRGIPQTEQQPEGVQIARDVSAAGTITSETNGRGFTTTYTYDGMNRLQTIQRPLGTIINVTWNTSGYLTRSRQVTRGAYSQTITFDGFGRPSEINTNGIAKNINYNAFGFKSFESYPGSLTNGDNIGTDVLGRVTSIAHPDGTALSFSYLSGNRVRETNQRGYLTTYTFRSFGGPENDAERVLMQIDAPEGVTTSFTRNVLGQMTSVTQGGITRTYNYYSTNNFLQSVVNPETGTTSFGRDAVGNMTSRIVGSSGTTTFGYDGLDRLIAIDYPGTTPDVGYTYDGNNNVLTANNGVTSRTYNYDQNDNLTSETLGVNGRSYTATYGYNALDYLQSVTYPHSGQVVALNPDALGRPTTVSPFITLPISYHANSVPSDFIYANGRRTDTALTSRQWLQQVRSYDSLTFVTHLGYAYDGRGNATTITDNVDTVFSRTMTYDGLDRLYTANGIWGSGEFRYDAVGNITRQTLGGMNLNYSYTSNRLAVVSGSRSYSFAYDAYGSVTSNGAYQFTYNDASNLVTVAQNGSSVATYTYDANNMRVRVQQDGKDTYAFYAKNGDLLGEYDADGRYKEYYYLGGKLIAMRGVSPNNVAPIANAGPDQSVDERANVTLNGSGSSDPDGTIVRYTWRQTAGPAVNLSNSAIAGPTFVAPSVRADTTLRFVLSVDDGDFGIASDEVVITVRNTSDDDDADGLSDNWEIQHFNTLAYGPNDDPDNDGITNLQEYQQGTNPNSATPPQGPPTDVTAGGGIASNSIRWQAPIGAVRYNIYWSATPGVTVSSNKISNVTGTSYHHAGLTNGTKYYYRVSAVNNAGESLLSAEVSATPGIGPLIPIIQMILEE
jgi:YD repeat-containing protein